MADEFEFGIHLRVIKAPFISIRDMVRLMTDVYTAYDIKPVMLSREQVDLPSFLFLDVGSCSHNAPLTNHQVELFQQANGVGAGEIVVFFVEGTIPPLLHGCARHPDGMPGAVVSHMSSRWTLAHEIGHLLGLDHVDDPDDHRSLMTGSGTLNIGSQNPVLSEAEVEVIKASPLVRRIP